LTREGRRYCVQQNVRPPPFVVDVSGSQLHPGTGGFGAPTPHVVPPSIGTPGYGVGLTG
jgi:hypothetical protein